eukprot:jgi/Ulvmu1/5521/UM023_0057.1
MAVGPVEHLPAVRVRVFVDGRVELAEWFGGFDGYPAVDPADGHETCFSSAVAEMFDVPLCDFERTTEGVGEETGEDIKAIICEENEDGSQCAADDKAASLKSQRGWEGNKGIITFLTTLRERSNPIKWINDSSPQMSPPNGRDEEHYLADLDAGRQCDGRYAFVRIRAVGFLHKAA